MIVVDASVAGKWILTEEYTTEARALLQQTLGAGETVAAPSLLPFEITNIMRKRVLRDGLDPRLAHIDLRIFFTIPIALHSSASLHQRALEIANQFNLRATYDAHYVALAEQLGCILWTDDQRLLRDLDGSFPFLRAIAGYTP